jgi:hypothetical protein
MSRPENLERREDLEQPTLRRPAQQPEQRVQQSEPVTPQRELPAKDRALPPEVPPQQSQDGLFDAITAGYRSTRASTEASKLWSQARQAELRGDINTSQRLKNQAMVRMRDAERLRASTSSIAEVDSLGGVISYAGSLIGSSAESVAQSTIGGAAGSLAAGAVTNLTPLGRLKKLSSAIQTAGGFAGAIAPQAEAVKGGIAMAQDLDPVIGARPVEERERAADLTAAGSLALEGLVPAAVGGRVANRIRARRAQLQGRPLPAGRVSQAGRLGLDSLEEGLTELGQTNLEQFALSLQNDELPRFAGLTENIDAFLGGVAGGAIGNVQGRVMSGIVDAASNQINRLDDGDRWTEMRQLDEAAGRGEISAPLNHFLGVGIPKLPGSRGLFMLVNSKSKLSRLPDIIESNGGDAELVRTLRTLQQDTNLENVTESMQAFQERDDISDRTRQTAFKLVDLMESFMGAQLLAQNPGNYDLLKDESTEIRKTFNKHMKRAQRLMRDPQLLGSVGADTINNLLEQITRGAEVTKNPEQAKVYETHQEEITREAAEGAALAGETVSDPADVEADIARNVFEGQSVQIYDDASSIEDAISPPDLLNQFTPVTYSKTPGIKNQNQIIPFMPGTLEERVMLKKILPEDPNMRLYGEYVTNDDGTSEFRSNAFGTLDPSPRDVSSVRYENWFDYAYERAKQNGFRGTREQAADLEAARLLEHYEERTRSNNQSPGPNRDATVAHHEEMIAKLRSALNSGDANGTIKLLNTFRVPLIRKQMYEDAGAQKGEFYSDAQLSALQRPLQGVFNRTNEQRAESRRNGIPVLFRRSRAEISDFERKNDTDGGEFYVAWLSRSEMARMEGRRAPEYEGDLQGEGQQKKERPIQERISSAMGRILNRPDVVGIAAVDPQTGELMREKLEDGRLTNTPLVQAEDGSFVPVNAENFDKMRTTKLAPRINFDFGNYSSGPDGRRIGSGPYSSDAAKADYYREQELLVQEQQARYRALRNEAQNYLRKELNAIEGRYGEVSDKVLGTIDLIAEGQLSENYQARTELLSELTEKMYQEYDKKKFNSVYQLLEADNNSAFAEEITMLSDIANAVSNTQRWLQAALAAQTPEEHSIVETMDGRLTGDTRKIMKYVIREFASDGYAVREMIRTLDQQIREIRTEERTYLERSEAGEAASGTEVRFDFSSLEQKANRRRASAVRRIEKRLRKRVKDSKARKELAEEVVAAAQRMATDEATLDYNFWKENSEEAEQELFKDLNLVKMIRSHQQQAMDAKVVQKIEAIGVEFSQLQDIVGQELAKERLAASISQNDSLSGLDSDAAKTVRALSGREAAATQTVGQLQQRFDELREAITERGKAVLQMEQEIQDTISDLFPDGIPADATPALARPAQERETDAELVYEMQRLQKQLDQAAEELDDIRFLKDKLLKERHEVKRRAVSGIPRNKDVINLQKTVASLTTNAEISDAVRALDGETLLERQLPKVEIVRPTRDEPSAAVKAMQKVREYGRKMAAVMREEESGPVLDVIRRAGALVTDRTNGINVKFQNLDPQDSVVFLLDSMPAENSALYRQMEAAKNAGLTIVLAKDSQINKDRQAKSAFVTFMQRKGYSNVASHEQVWVPNDNHPALSHERYADFRRRLQEMQFQQGQFREALTKRKILDADNLYVQALRWRFAAATNQTPFLNDSGKRSFNLSSADKKLKEERGIELEWFDQDGFTPRVRVTFTPAGRARRAELLGDPLSKKEKKAKKGRKKKEGKKKAESIGEQQDKVEKNAQEHYRQSAINTVKQTDAFLKAAMGSLGDPASPDNLKLLTEFFESWGVYTPAERRARADLNRALLRNKRVLAQIRALTEQGDGEGGILGLSKEQVQEINQNENAFLAYAYQLWSIGAIRVTPETNNIFKEILRKFLGLLNITMSSEFVNTMFTNMSQGQILNRKDIPAFYKRSQTGTDEYVASMGKLLRELTKRSVLTSAQVIARLDPELSERFAKPEYATGTVKNRDFLNKRQRQSDFWMNRFQTKVAEKFTEEQLQEGWEDFRVNGPNAQTAAGKQLMRFADSFYRYMDSRGTRLRIRKKDGKSVTVTPNAIKWRAPAAWDAKYIRENRDEFFNLLTKNGLSQDEATSFIDSINWANGQVSFLDSKWDKEAWAFTRDDSRPGTGTLSNYSQIINGANSPEFAKFLHDDVQFAFGRMIQQGVHKAEFSQVFGWNGREIEKARLLLEAKGMSEPELAYFDRSVDALLGNLTYNMNPRLRQWVGNVVSIQNMSILPLIIFSSIPEIWGSSLASGELKTAYGSLKSGAAEIMNSFSKEKDGTEKMARLMGVISDDVMNNRISDTYNEMMMGTSMKKLNQSFFRLTGIEQWTKGLRIAAMHAGIDYIVTHKDDAKKLAPLNITPEDVKFRNGELIIRYGDPDDPMVHAITTFVDQSVLRPQSQHRPAWGSDPRFLLVWHLKQFTWAFHNVFTKRVWDSAFSRDAGERVNWAVIAAYAMMVPTIMISDLIKNTILPTSQAYDAASLGDHVVTGVTRSGILGLGSLAADEYASVAQYHDHIGASFLGPTYNHMQEFLTGNELKGIARLTPGWVIWNRF